MLVFDIKFVDGFLFVSFPWPKNWTWEVSLLTKKLTFKQMKTHKLLYTEIIQLKYPSIAETFEDFSRGLYKFEV